MAPESISSRCGILLRGLESSGGGRSGEPDATMVLRIVAEKLTIEGYAPFGGVISTDVVNSGTVMANGGTSRRTPEVVPTVNAYNEAPSGKLGHTVLNAALSQPRQVECCEESSMQLFRFGMLEKHPFTTQSFVPMGAEVKYLVIVTDGEDEPNIHNLKAFVASSKQGVCYGRAVWHAPMSVVGKEVRRPGGLVLTWAACIFCSPPKRQRR